MVKMKKPSIFFKSFLLFLILIFVLLPISFNTFTTRRIQFFSLSLSLSLSLSISLCDWFSRSFTSPSRSLISISCSLSFPLWSGEEKDWWNFSLQHILSGSNNFQVCSRSTAFSFLLFLFSDRLPDVSHPVFTLF